PFLEEAGVVVLDEFHERHLQGDVALAVVRELQQTVRPELRLVVMSATLDTEPLATYLGGAAVLTAEGRAYPVRIEVAAAHDLLVLPLHGDLPLDAQQQVLRRAARRKVVLATNVAETSLTIDGITTVIDSGLARIARYDPRHGVNTLRIAPISRAAAEQRAGRAGRTAPGRCVRLWTAAEHAARLEREIPEIHRLELSATLLELRAWGLRDARRFQWLDPPRPAALARAERLLVSIGAIDAAGGELTDTGKRLLEIAAPPRLARVLLEAERRGCAAEGALLAAL